MGRKEVKMGRNCWRRNEKMGDVKRQYLGVSKNRGENPQNGWWKEWKTLLNWDDLGGKPTIFGNIHLFVNDECLPTPSKRCQMVPKWVSIHHLLGFNWHPFEAPRFKLFFLLLVRFFLLLLLLFIDRQLFWGVHCYWQGFQIPNFWKNLSRRRWKQKW